MLLQLESALDLELAGLVDELHSPTKRMNSFSNLTRRRAPTFMTAWADLITRLSFSPALYLTFPTSLPSSSHFLLSLPKPLLQSSFQAPDVVSACMQYTSEWESKCKTKATKLTGESKKIAAEYAKKTQDEILSQQNQM
jgi:hypothetical protein